MSSKDKEKTLQDRLKQFFRLNKGGTGNIKGRLDISLTLEIESEIGPESPIQHRIKVIRELSEAVLQNHLEERAIEKLWLLTEDLLKEDVARENRHAVFQFLCSLAQGQADKLGLMRVQFFRVITAHSLSEDIGPRLELLRALTDNGKDITYIEEKVAPFVLSWFPAVNAANKTQDLLSLLVNLVKYNAVYVEDYAISGLIQNTCILCTYRHQEEVVLASLALLDVVVCYAQMPPDTLSTVISMLCITVNNKSFSTNCWKIMRKLLGTHLGHSALLHMCRLMQTENAATETKVLLLRGAVFLVSMGMWGNQDQRVSSLHTTAAAVLPSFVQVLQRSHNNMIAYEVIMCVRRLVTQSPQCLTDPAWDCVLVILEEAVAQAHSHVAAELHNAISEIEAQHERGGFRGDLPRFFRLVESCSTSRPEPSVLRLLNHLAVDLSPTRTEWLTRLRVLVDRYFWQETRTNVRVKAIDLLSTVVHSHRALYEEELVECVLSLQLQDAARDTDPAVRNAVVQLLVSLALESESKRCLEILDLIEKFLNQPFETHEIDGSVVSGEAEALDVKSAALGLIKIFQSKSYQLPSSHAIRAYRALVNHLEAHYHQPTVFEKCSITRFLIFRCFLQIRADSLYHLGMPETLALLDEETSSSPLRFSPYLAVDHRHGERPSTAVPTTLQPGSGSPPQTQQQPQQSGGVTLQTSTAARLSAQPNASVSQQSGGTTMQTSTAARLSAQPNVSISQQSGGATVQTSTSVRSSAQPNASISQQSGGVTVQTSTLARPSTQPIVSMSQQSGGTTMQTFTIARPGTQPTVNVSQQSPAGTGSAGQPPQPPVPVPLPSPVVTHLSLQHACKAVIVCLKQEKDWRVLGLVLRELPRVLQNKALVLSRHGNDVEYLAAALCFMVSERTHNLPESLRNTPQKFSRSDFHSVVLTSMGPLASYPLEPSLQQRLVKCLQVGLVSRSAGTCVTALTLCTLEMRDTMYKLLPEVLLNLSKISATVVVAIPILEFLSTLTRLPKVFASFVGDQYMSVFAITMPYTNPFKYNHYTVSLAHHVIAVWFLKCRLPFRRDFVKYLISGLKANAPQNEDSSNRKRSSSLTEEGSRRREQLTATRLDQVKQQPPGMDDGLFTFNTELTETCIDLMARHTFSSCAALPRRLSSAEWIFSGGLSMTWILGYKLVTVTTSGCSQKAIRNGLCDKCLSTCRLASDKVLTTMVPVSPLQQQQIEPELELTPSRRRHKSAIQRSVCSDVAPNTPRTKDDLHMTGTRPSEPTEGFFGQQTERGVECSCWCQGWAEIHIRRPTGNMSWVMRLQNPPYLHTSSPFAPDFPMSDISTLFLPSLAAEEIQLGTSALTSSPEAKDPLLDSSLQMTNSSAIHTPTPLAVNSPNASRPTSEAVPVPGSSSSLDQEDSEGSEGGDSEDGRSRNPVRRSNSSPEMSGRPLKSPLTTLPAAGTTEQETPQSPIHEEKKLAPKQPPTRVSCEAIPEEMGGTTPPAGSVPPLQSSVSYPGHAKTVLAPTRSAPPPQQQPSTVVTSAEKHPDVPQSSQQETKPDPSALPPLAFRDRGHTISVMSPVRKPDWGAIRRQQAAALGGGPASPRSTKEPPRSGVNPSFVFVQLYHDGQLGGMTDVEQPLLVPQSEMVSLTLRTLDYIPPYETHKLGVLYVGPGQADNEAAILQNTAGSVRYTEFLQGLGTLIRLRDVDPATTFLGGLDTSGNDGKFAYVWQDAMTQVIFHAATLMPTKETDPSCNNKKLHIGNDYVTIVFNESGQDYNVQCIKGQFNFACVVVTPQGHGTNQVVVKSKEVLAKHLGSCSEEYRVISDQSLPTLVRQLALHANLASMIVKQTQTRYASNWLERLRHIKRLRARVCAGLDAAGATTASATTAAGGEGSTAAGSRATTTSTGLNRRAQLDDFTEYTHYK